MVESIILGIIYAAIEIGCVQLILNGLMFNVDLLNNDAIEPLMLIVVFINIIIQYKKYKLCKYNQRVYYRDSNGNMRWK